MQAMQESISRTPEPKREPAASQMLTMLEKTTNRVQELNLRLTDRTASVCDQGPSEAPECGEDAESWPPLFSAARNQIMQIEEAVREMNDTLDRLEL